MSHDTHQSIELTLLYWWIGMLAVAGLTYLIARRWSSRHPRPKPPSPPRPTKYAERLSQRLNGTDANVAEPNASAGHRRHSKNH